MFVRASIIVAALAGFAAAIPTELEARGGSQTCNSGNVMCCSSVQNSDTSFVQGLFSFLNLPLPSSTTQIGLTCSPVTVGGVGSGATCTQQTVCCEGNTFSGVIVTGCSPTIINL